VIQTAVTIGYSAAASVSGAVAGAGEELGTMVEQARDLRHRSASPNLSGH
jgi:hypothetical protein